MELYNVTVIKRANVYFGGKVASRTIILENNEKKTLGFMQAGEYEFNTECEELMEVIGGEMQVMVKGEAEYKTYVDNTSFVVPANSSFKLIVKEYADYCCSYKK